MSSVSMTRRLRIQFERADEFRREFDRNIAKGGAFVPGACDVELREVVDVEIVLPFCDQRRTLEAEVVHVVDAATAPSRAAAGAAVQFLRPASELRAELAGLLASAGLEAGRVAPASRSAAAEPPSELRLDELDESEGLEIGDLDLLDGAGSLEQAPPPAPLAAAWDAQERRKSPRSPARVVASLDGSNARVEGVTRDLSETGALISADASELPPGKAVRLALQHPETGDRVEVDGRVVRHLETEGTVAAVSVLFDVPAGRKAEVAELVRAAQSAHRQRSESGISGRIEELGMPNLIQMLGRSSPCGTLAVRSGTEEGVVAFEAGTLRYVRLGATRSLKALARMLLWREGSFEFHAHVAALDAEDAAMGLEAALLEATRRLDEAARLRTARFEPGLRFRVDRAALAAAGALAKTEEAVLDLAAAGFTVRRILDVIPEDDAQVSAALLALVERGVLAPSS
jgi:hypothetical protein